MRLIGPQTIQGQVSTSQIENNAVNETKLKDALIGDYSDVTITASDLIMYGDATDSNNTKRDTVQGILDLAGAGDYLLYEHRLSNDTNGTNYTSNAWRTVTLNTEVFDTGNHGSLSSNVITLAAGTYRVTARTVIASASGTMYASVRFRNTSDSSTVANSGQFAQDQDRMVQPICRGRFTIAGAKDFEFQVWPGSQNGYEGKGPTSSKGEQEVWGSVYLEKE